MQPIVNQDVTMKYKYGNNDEEFVMCYKSRPFSVMSSSHLPTPTSSYIDHLLVRELGIKMTDFQCKKISFSGVKLRLLGKVSITVQCINNGRLCGNFHLTASVIENLYSHFDTHCIAGQRTNILLRGGYCNSSGAPSESSSPRSSRSSAPRSRTPSPAPSPSRSPSPPVITSYPTTPTKSPPGFGPRPQYSRPRFDTSSRPRHGPGVCSWQHCVLAHGGEIPPDVPGECGYHPQWRLPQDFRACGLRCCGWYCSCLQSRTMPLPRITDGWINYLQDNNYLWS